MEKYIEIDILIKKAKDRGFNFGKGDPYNRLRYYTKMGWIPNMKRMKNQKGNVEGHLPESTIDRLLEIQQLKENGLTNEEISQTLKNLDRKEGFYNFVTHSGTKTKIVIYSLITLFVIILLNQLGFIQFSFSTNKFTNTQDIINIGNSPLLQTKIIDAGSSFVPTGMNKVFVVSEKVEVNTKINVTFKNDYSPASRYWVSNQIPNEGFEIELDSPVDNFAEFDWWVTK